VGWWLTKPAIRLPTINIPEADLTVERYDQLPGVSGMRTLMMVGSQIISKKVPENFFRWKAAT
jgi:hypothetical protein